MSYRSILVNIAVDGPVEPVVTAAAGLARRFEARLIGLCAADIETPVVFPDGGVMVAEVWRQAQEDIEKRFGETRLAFERLTTDAELRLIMRNPSQALTEASRTADLIVTAAPKGAASGDAYRTADPASVVLHAGRPLLVIGDGAEQVAPENVVVLWKDGREARRAVADAIPFLAAARQVTVVTVARTVDEEIRAGAEDVIAFLAAHKIAAEAELIERSDENPALLDFIAARGPDLVVSGAYGHSRLREWAFGGMTRSLLDQTGLNRFMSS